MKSISLIRERANERRIRLSRRAFADPVARCVRALADTIPSTMSVIGASPISHEPVVIGKRYKTRRIRKKGRLVLVRALSMICGAGVMLAVQQSALAQAPWAHPQSSADTLSLDERNQSTGTIDARAGSSGGVSRSSGATTDTGNAGNIVLSPSGTLTITEGTSEEISVSLDTAPASGDDVTVTMSLSGAFGSGLSLDPTTLTFTSTDYSGKDVTVSAAHDDSTTDHTATINFTPSGGIQASAVTKAVSVEDDDDPGFDINPASLSRDATEGGRTSFGVHLSYRPSQTITVTIAADSGLTVVPSTLNFDRFSGRAWNRDQWVSVVADEDDDVNDETLDVAITAAGGDYEGLKATVTVNVSDDDVPGDIVLSDTGRMEVMEGRSVSRSVSLRLDQGVTALKRDVTLSFASERSNVTISPKTLTFTSSNYTTAQAFSVFGVEDDDFLVAFDKITLSHSGGITASPMSWQVVIDDNDSPPVGSIVLSDVQTAPISEGDSTTIGVSLSKAPTGRTRVSLSSDIPQAIVSPASLFFTPANYSIAQMVSIMALEDDDATDETASITIEVTTQGVEGGFSAEPVIHKISIVDNDKPEPPPQVHNYDGTLIVVPEAYLEIDEGGEGVFDMRLSAKPNGDVSVRIAKVSDTLGITHDRNLLTFTPSNWNEDQSIKIIVHEDKDANDIIHTYSFAFENQRLLRDVIVNDTALGSLQAQALALPPPRGGDEATLRIRCRQDTPCAVDLDCSAQADGTIYRGRLPEPIPKNGARSYTAQQITELMGWETWEGKGRLECLLRGDANISAQVWTRSGAGVLVNNSAMIRSIRNVGIYRADIESIPSPDSPDESNIRIRCNSGVGDCLDTLIVCYLDDGRRLARWHLGRIERLTTRHIQSEELASNILYRWEGMGLGCEVSSKGRFTVQVLTRTGGGGALVNNSATGGG